MRLFSTTFLYPINYDTLLIMDTLTHEFYKVSSISLYHPRRVAYQFIKYPENNYDLDELKRGKTFHNY